VRQNESFTVYAIKKLICHQKFCLPPGATDLNFRDPYAIPFAFCQIFTVRRPDMWDRTCEMSILPFESLRSGSLLS
jgi:hypothetical protein